MISLQHVIMTVSSPEVITNDLEYKDVMKKITEVVGIPKNYGPSPEEQEEEDRKKREEKKLKLAAEAAEKKRKNEAALAEMAAQYEEWVSFIWFMQSVSIQHCRKKEAERSKNMTSENILPFEY